MGSSACNDCFNMIKAHVHLGGNDPALWACTHPLRAPISCYTGMENGHLGYQDSECPDQDPGKCYYIEYGEEDSGELRVLRRHHGDYSHVYLSRGVEIALEKHMGHEEDEEE